MLLDLDAVAAAKFLPPGGIMPEPLPQRGAGCNVLDPLIDRCIRFLDPTRPQPVDEYPSAVAGRGGLVSSLELDVVSSGPLAHQSRSGCLSVARFLQCMTFMHRDVVGLHTLDFVLRIIGARVTGIPLVINVFCMHFDDHAADMASLGVPSHVIADLKSIAHHEPPLAAVVRRPAKPSHGSPGCSSYSRR